MTARTWCRETRNMTNLKPMSQTTKHFLAHVRKSHDGSFAIHELAEHLQAVATLAGRFGESFGCSDWAHLVGLWHDLGKYSSAFQNYIARGSGFDPKTHIEGGEGYVNHS